MIDIEHKFKPDEAATTLQPYLNPLPRSVFRHNAYVLLDQAFQVLIL